jgi:hypothetical protein
VERLRVQDYTVSETDKYLQIFGGNLKNQTMLRKNLPLPLLIWDWIQGCASVGGGKVPPPFFGCAFVLKYTSKLQHLASLGYSMRGRERIRSNAKKTMNPK